MVILIADPSTEGDAVQCDARCYNAKRPRCECICGGDNHGVGFEQAVDNTRDLVEAWKEEGRDISGLRLAIDVLQEPLFRMSELEADLMTTGKIWYHGIGQGAGGRAIIIEDAAGNMLGTVAHMAKHSPTGLSWGYAGSGAADAARSLLLAALGDDAKCRICNGTRRVAWDAKANRDVAFRPGVHHEEEAYGCMCEDGYRVSAALYQDFKFQFVAAWADDWRMSRDGILRWVVTQSEWQEG
jgi:hypothetical protein